MPYVVGVPSSFFSTKRDFRLVIIILITYKKINFLLMYYFINKKFTTITIFIFRFPKDVWIVDLDSNKITPPIVVNREDAIPQLPKSESITLKNSLKSVTINSI